MQKLQDPRLIGFLALNLFVASYLLIAQEQTLIPGLLIALSALLIFIPGAKKVSDADEEAFKNILSVSNDVSKGKLPTAFTTTTYAPRLDNSPTPSTTCLTKPKWFCVKPATASTR